MPLQDHSDFLLQRKTSSNDTQTTSEEYMQSKENYLSHYFVPDNLFLKRLMCFLVTFCSRSKAEIFVSGRVKRKKKKVGKGGGREGVGVSN